jgi:flagellar hook-associated protein 1 FlgK
VPVSTTTASRFGLDAGNSTAMLQGRAISENATYPLTLSVSVGRGSDITDITVTVASIDGELTLTSDDDAKLTPIIIDVNGSSFLQLRAAEGAGPISVKGEGNPALGFKVGAADLTVEDGVLRARSTDGAAIDMKAGGVSAAGSYVKLTDIPDEDLIIIMGEDGAKRLGGEFEVGPPLKNADRKSELFRVEMIDDGTGRVELFDRDSGASIATRFSNGLVKFDVSGQTIELAGFAKTGDIFDLATGQRAAGDARNMDELASLGQQRSGFQSFQDQFRSIAAGVGSTLEAARFTLLSNEAVRDAAVETESEMSGVNLDEEAAKLMSQQQAYQAAARILQTAREMFDTLLQIA